MTREELDKAKALVKKPEDKRMLIHLYEALAICTMHDLKRLTLHEIKGRRKAVISGLECADKIGTDLGTEIDVVVYNARAELHRRLTGHEALIEKLEGLEKKP